MVVIHIDKGKIKGKIGIDSQGGKFYSFQNIPYAAPPIGNLRFKAPQQPQPWSDIRDATQEGNESVSRHLFTRKVVGSEDCLNLNVYTPELPSNGLKRLKPVMFWIHGGVFITGSNKTELYGPEFLMAEDVVLVTINYRLGILGFLSLDDASLGVPGNAGFKDMVMALKWAQNNISCFCGDPNNVTLFGESAGAVSAHLLMLSPMAKGLFHRVIAQSACALNVWVMGRRYAKRIASDLGFDNSDDRKILPFLQNVSAEEILKVQTKLNHEDFAETDVRFIGAVVERPSNEEPFLSERPLDIMLSGNYNQIPLIIGYNHTEGIAFKDVVPARARKNFFNDMQLSIPFLLNIQRDCDVSKMIAKRIRNFYFGDVIPNERRHAREYDILCTDTCFLRDIYLAVKTQVRTSTKPIYFYRMCVETELNILKKVTRTNAPGVYHGDEMCYLFKTMFTPDYEVGSIEDVMQRKFTRLWTNFARYGNPTPDRNDQFLNVEWKKVEIDKMNFLDFRTELKMLVDPEPQRMAFWDDIFFSNPAISKL